MKTNSIPDLKEMLKAGKLKQVFDYLLEIALKNDDNQLHNDLLAMQLSYNENERGRIMNAIQPEDYRIEKTRITNGLLYFIDTISNKYFEVTSSTTKTSIELQEELGSEKYTLRTHLNDILQKLVDTYKYEFELDNQKTNFHKQSDYLNERRIILTQQAVWIMDKIHKAVSSAEYNLVARMLYSTSDYIKSEEYHKKAIEAADSSFRLIAVVRSYADFLYLTSRPVEGAKQYDAAILPEDTNQNKATNGFTYQMRFRNEALQVSNLNYDYTEVKEVYKKAKEYFEGISDLRNRAYWLERLEKDWIANVPFIVERPN